MLGAILATAHGVNLLLYPNGGALHAFSADAAVARDDEQNG
jgi:hypothetical protein